MADAAYHKIRTDRALAPSGCPVNHDFSPFSSSYMANPYAELERLRGEQPVFIRKNSATSRAREDVAKVFRAVSSENQDQSYRSATRHR